MVGITRSAPLALLLLLCAACGKSDDPAARAERLSAEMAGAVHNSGLGGVIQKGQLVALDAALTLTQNRIVCILDEGEIAQIADCGDESGWISSSAKIPLKEIEPASISVSSPNRSRGEDGFLVFFACRKDAGQCIHWTNPMPSSANGGVFCKTPETCAGAAEDLSALVTLAQPEAAPAVDQGAEAAALLSRVGAEIQGATFNNGTTGSIERHNQLVLQADGALRLNAEICLGKDGRTVDIARCGVDFDWSTINATFAPHEIDPGTVAVHPADPARGESGMLVNARCWKYAGNCVRWSAPAPDQASVSLNCKNVAGCETLTRGLVELARTGRQRLADESGGAAGIAARMSELRHELTHVSEGAVTVKRGGEISVDGAGVLRAVESSCVLQSGEALADTCNAHPEYWAVQETTFALGDIDASTIEDSSVEPELLSYTFYVKCREDRGDCITMKTTGASKDTREVSGTNLLCRDNDACRQTSALLVTLVQSNGAP